MSACTNRFKQRQSSSSSKPATNEQIPAGGCFTLVGQVMDATMTAAMTGHGRPWSTTDPAMANHDRTWIRSWPTMVDDGRPWPTMAGSVSTMVCALVVDHVRVHGRSHGRSWTSTVDHGKPWPGPWSTMMNHGCGHGLCNYLSFVAEFMAEAMVDNG